jgi:hypothetical protein
MILVQTLIARAGTNAPDAVTALAVIEAATTWLENRTSRYFGDYEPTEEYLLGNGSDLLQLTNAPTVDDVNDSGGVTVAVTEASYPGADEDAITDFVVRGRSLYRVHPARWYRGHEYRVSYTRGYQFDDGPADAREAVLQMALLLWQQADADLVGLKGEELGDYSWEGAAAGKDFASELPLVNSVIEHYRRIPIA